MHQIACICDLNANKILNDTNEFDRMDKLVKGLAKEFKLNIEVIKDIIEEFGDTTKKLYIHIANVVGINADTLIKLNRIGR